MQENRRLHFTYYLKKSKQKQNKKSVDKLPSQSSIYCFRNSNSTEALFKDYKIA